MDATTTKARIAALNDQHRRSPLLPPHRGRTVMTRGVAALPAEQQMATFSLLIHYDRFVTANDPHQEHDFGVIEVAGEKVFWKFDYYADDTLTYGSEAPDDPARCLRVLTLMLAREY